MVYLWIKAGPAYDCGAERPSSQTGLRCARSPARERYGFTRP